MTSTLSPTITRADDPVVVGADLPPGSGDYRAAGFVALIGVALCSVGSVFNQALPDADIYAAMETASSSDRARLLLEVADAKTSIVAGFAIWMIAFPVTAAATLLLVRLGRQSALTHFVRYATTAAIGAIMVFLSMFITFTAVIAPAHAAGEDVLTLAHVVGHTATTMDWAVSAIVLGLGPIVAVYAGRGIWAPRWLLGLAGVASVVTIVEVGALIADARALLFPIVPVGLLLIACSGVCAIRYSRELSR